MLKIHTDQLQPFLHSAHLLYFLLVQAFKQLLSLLDIHLKCRRQLIDIGVFAQLQHRLNDVLQHILIVKFIECLVERNVPGFRNSFSTLFSFLRLHHLDFGLPCILITLFTTLFCSVLSGTTVNPKVLPNFNKLRKDRSTLVQT